MKQSVDQPITNPAAHASGSTNVSGARMTKSGGASGNASRLECGHDVVGEQSIRTRSYVIHIVKALNNCVRVRAAFMSWQ